MKRCIATPTTVLILSMALASCATLDEKQCRTINWQQLGYDDGAKGRSTTRLAEHQDACQKYKIAPDATGWQLGYAQGQGVYCTAANGFETGRRGDSYGNVCPAELDRNFRPAFEDGRGIAERVSKLHELESRLRDIRSTLDNDDRRARDYVDAVRKNGNQTPPPELLDRKARRTLERDYDYLLDDYRGRTHELGNADADRSDYYQARPLQFNAAY